MGGIAFREARVRHSGRTDMMSEDGAGNLFLGPSDIFHVSTWLLDMTTRTTGGWTGKPSAMGTGTCSAEVRTKHVRCPMGLNT